MERHRQNIKWGKQEHSLVEWMAILTEEVGEAAKEAVDYHFSNPLPFEAGLNPSPSTVQYRRLIAYRKELIQTAAVAVSMIEDLDKRYLNQ